MRAWFRLSLYVQIFIGLGLGILAGLIFGEKMSVLSPVGDIFINLLKMVIVPVVFFSLIAGTTSLSSATKLLKVGVKTIVLFLGTGFCAVVIGLLVANIVRPGDGLSLPSPEGNLEMAAKMPGVVEQIVAIVPTNIINSLANADMLQIICFAIFFGCALLMMGERAKPINSAIATCAEAMYKIVGWIMMLSPYAIFCIMGSVVGQFGWDVLKSMGTFLFTMYGAVIIHIFIVYTLIMVFIAKVSPVKFFRKAFKAWIVAFSVCSSNAALPVTMKVAEEDLGVPNETASFILPLGATCNMNGSAIYFATVTIFVAQIYGIDFSLGQQITLMLTAVLMSVGCAAIPNAALVLSVALLTSMGVPAEPILIITGMYRLIDQAETSTNVLGDLATAVAVSATEEDLDRSVFNNMNLEEERLAA